MTSTPTKIAQLIDFDNADGYSLRKLMSICNEHKLKLPLHPTRDHLIQAISNYQQILKMNERNRQLAEKYKNGAKTHYNYFSTPVLPLSIDNCSEDSLPTPLVMSKRVPSLLSDNSNVRLVPYPSRGLAPTISLEKYTSKKINKDVNKTQNNKSIYYIENRKCINCILVFVIFVFLALCGFIYF